ncbi:MAG TPA: DUF3618 domain-containing protein [Solirubrobacteraceae bacterium]|nr:DUF3618 domain-containing protein [Solirubrobacteraceae bacterium]
MAENQPAGEDPAVRSDTAKTPEELRGEIAEARSELGDTVEQLAAKADVKGRAQDKVEETKERARGKIEEGREQVRHATERVQAEAQEKRAEGIHTEDVQAVAQKAKDNPAVPIGIAVGVGLVVLLVLRGRRD